MNSVCIDRSRRDTPSEYRSTAHHGSNFVDSRRGGDIYNWLHLGQHEQLDSEFRGSSHATSCRIMSNSSRRQPKICHHTELNRLSTSSHTTFLFKLDRNCVSLLVERFLFVADFKAHNRRHSYVRCARIRAY